ncbi:hypothetical protein RchiOBHm_Chr6g0277531 [Rosa chinensis]|uniref:Uncharacterized protein n=1 Tax=Rosa chinensis TaxID=74649 RepID=A0A2P6PSK6_ROSCH|nr:hypothetical protein RchiOBHm_Chr6g0277531 [Rosa chinensis]
MLRLFGNVNLSWGKSVKGLLCDIALWGSLVGGIIKEVKELCELYPGLGGASVVWS